LNATTTTVAQAPGRICLLGDNVDLIEEHVLAAAISAFLRVELHRRQDDVIILIGNDIGIREEFRIGDPLTFESPLKYMKAVFRRLEDHVDSGFVATVSSQIPISAGLSSSTALCIAFIRALSQEYAIALDADGIAELSFLVEREDLNIECGRMDQYAIAYGGVTYIDTGSHPSVERIPVDSLPIVVADTQEQHSTQELQEWLQNRLRAKDQTLHESLLRVVALVEQGRESLLSGDLESLGDLMNRQQMEERIMGTSTDRLDLFCKTALAAGAWGAKQMGAGGGGCTLSLCPPSRLRLVQSAFVALGAPAWAFEVYRGQ